MSSRRNLRCAPSPRRTDRGSAVITVLVLAAVTAVIASGFLFRSTQEARLATRSYFQAVARNLAEAGIEEGLYAVNTLTLTSTNGWSLVSGSTTDYQKTITTDLNFDQATGAIYIRADGANGTTPVVTAAGVITIPNQPRIVKQLRIAGTGPRRLFGNGIVAKGTVTFSGSSDIDSYDSSLGTWNAATNRSDKATVATNATVSVSGSATIYGYVATGGTAPSVGGSGRIYGATTPSGTAIDSSRVRTDFNANLTNATAPTDTPISLGSVNSSVTLPRTGDAVGPNGRYLYRASKIELNGSNVLTINGPVDIISDADVTVNGNAQILVSSGTSKSLNVYCATTITLNGGGMVNNTGDASKATLWGTKASGTQSIEINGSAAFCGTVYVPNGNVQLSGTSDVLGAIICNTITLSGTGGIHYDTQLALANISGGPTPSSSGGGNTVAISAWAELNSAPNSGSAFARDNRAPFSGLF